MSASVYSTDGVLRERWDDTTRTYTAYNAQGTQTSTRSYTTQENDIADATAVVETAGRNRDTIEEQAGAALDANTAYLAIATPTNAQVAAQVKALTRQNNKIIRLALGRLDGTD